MPNGNILTSERLTPGVGGGPGIDLQQIFDMLVQRKLQSGASGQAAPVPPAPASPTLPASTAPPSPDLEALYKAVTERYSPEERRRIEEAQSSKLTSLGRREALAGLGQGLARIAGGSTIEPGQFFAGEREQAKAPLERFEAGRKRELEDLMESYRFGREGVKAGQEDVEFGQEQEDRKVAKQLEKDVKDPNSEISQRAREEFQEMLKRAAPPNMTAERWDKLRPGFISLEKQRMVSEAALAKAQATGLSATAQKTLSDESKAENAARSAQTDAMYALELLEEYSRSTLAGTGVGAVAKSYAGAFAPGTQQLEAAFKRLEVQRVIEIAREAGARSADSDAERRAIAATAPRLAYDDEVNRKIILAMASQAARGEYLSRKRQEHIAQTGSLSGFDPGVLDESITTVYHPQSQEIHVVPKEEASRFTGQGYINIKDIIFPERSVQPRTQAPTSATVRMITPDGRTVDIPADKVQEAERRGARRQ